MKKLARKFRNSEDGNLSLPIHDGDSRPLDSQGTIFLNYFRLHKNKIKKKIILFIKFELGHLSNEDLDFDVMHRARRACSFFRKESSSAESRMEGTYTTQCYHFCFCFTHMGLMLTLIFCCCVQTVFATLFFCYIVFLLYSIFHQASTPWELVCFKTSCYVMH